MVIGGHLGDRTGKLGHFHLTLIISFQAAVHHLPLARLQTCAHKNTGYHLPILKQNPELDNKTVLHVGEQTKFMRTLFILIFKCKIL